VLFIQSVIHLNKDMGRKLEKSLETEIKPKILANNLLDKILLQENENMPYLVDSFND